MVATCLQLIFSCRNNWCNVPYFRIISCEIFGICFISLMFHLTQLSLLWVDVKKKGQLLYSLLNRLSYQLENVNKMSNCLIIKSVFFFLVLRFSPCFGSGLVQRLVGCRFSWQHGPWWNWLSGQHGPWWNWLSGHRSVISTWPDSSSVRMGVEARWFSLWK